MWARFTVLRDTPIDSAIAGCVIPFSRSNTIWMRWRCWGCPFQRSAVFKRRISFLVHLTTCSSESNQIRWSVRIILRLTNAIHIRIRCFATINIRFNQLWKRYYIPSLSNCNESTFDPEAMRKGIFFTRNNTQIERNESDIVMADPATGETKKRTHNVHPNVSGVLTTAGGLAF